MGSALDALFAPGRIGTMSVRNRVVMPPMATNYATWTGAVTDRLIDYHAERARGGVGLITVEFTAVHPTGRGSYYTLGIDDDALIPGLRRLSRAIQAEGANASIQLAHVGRRGRSAISGSQPLAPSAVACLGGEPPRELSVAEIEQVVRWFVDGARRARDAGFDAVTLHLANGYLLQGFTSPYANRRTDRYGGSIEGRMRLPVEILYGIRGELGVDFPVICRLCVDEFVEGGVTLAEGTRMAQLLERAGADAIDVTAGIPETMHVIGPPMATPRAFLAAHARAVREAVGIPVFAVGRINTPAVAAQIVADGSADFVAIGRALIADPELPAKARAGRVDDIRPCIACNEGCFQRLYSQVDITCVTNPRVGRERLFPIEPARRSRTVLIAGGGPGGMMAAITAAARGHRVVLCESSERLGGQLVMGDVPPHKEEITRLREYLVQQVGKARVDTRVKTTVTAELVEAMAPEVVIVATGARPMPLAVPTDGARIVSAWDVLSGTATTGAKVVVIGGGEVGCELAEHLRAQGKDVVIVELLHDVALTMEPRGRTLLVQRLRQLGVGVLARAKVVEVSARAVVYEQGGIQSRVEDVDTVVSAVGSTANNTLPGALAAAPATLHVIGDSVKPRRILEAIREGFEVAYRI